MSILKKVSAVSLCAAMALSLSACNLGGADTTYGAEIDGYKVPAGVFISMQMDAYYDAMSKVNAASSGTDVTSEEEGAKTTTTPFTDNTVEDKPVRDWVNDEATKSMQQFVAVENKFDELGLAFENNEKEKIKIYLDSMWETYGSVYEGYGISENSQVLRNLNSVKKNLIFDHYYGKGGEKEISEKDIRNYLLENNARINYIEMQLKDGDGNLLKSEGKEEMKKLADDYVSRAQNGEDFGALLKEFDDYYTQFKKDTMSDTTVDVGEESSEAPDNTMVVSKGGMYPFAEKIDKVFSGEIKPGEVFFTESNDSETYYVVKILDLFEDEDYYEDNESYVRHTMKDDEFDAAVESWTSSQNVVKNSAAYKRYKIEKFMD